jgi:hypothetical protein
MKPSSGRRGQKKELLTPRGRGLWLAGGAMRSRADTRRATVSGSFRRAMRQIQEAVYGLTDLGVMVLSPADPRVVDELGAFLFVASDRLRIVRLVQQRHLQAISMSDFLWLVAPDGYVGTSAAMEIGFAVASSVPIFATTAPTDVTLREFVTVVPDINSVLLRTSPPSPPSAARALLDPAAAVEQAHRGLEEVKAGLLGDRREVDLNEWRTDVADLIDVSRHL